MAGYSGTPLARKLGIAEGDRQPGGRHDRVAIEIAVDRVLGRA